MAEQYMSEPYVAADCELDEVHLEACHQMLNQVVDIALEEPSENDEWVTPQVTIAAMMGSLAKLQTRLLCSNAVLLEAMEESSSASDQLLRTQDLLASLEYIGQCMNRSYYAACKLVITMGDDEELYEAALNAAVKMKEDLLESAEAEA